MFSISKMRAKSRFLFNPILLFALATTLILPACKSGSSDNKSGDDVGELVLGLTDAKGDFLHYAVDVKQIRLQKANGAVVNLLPNTTRVDFAEYTNMTEFLTAAMIPSGVYVRAQMLLDYSNADIWVEGANGDPQQVTAVYDSDGATVTELVAQVQLQGINRVLIAPGTPVHMTLDFDLNASNQVEFDATTGDASVVVEPLLSADLDLTRAKIHRLRGPLLSVDEANNRFRVVIRPFIHALANDRAFGTLAVETSSTTVYEINGEDFSGTAGISAMAQLPQYSAIVVRGDLAVNPFRFVATSVYAGSSVPGGTLDVAAGHVIARSGDVLTIKGPTLIRAGGAVEFGQSVNVSVGVDTKVRKQGSIAALDISAISVGQRISVFGTLSGDAASGFSMDASNGAARLHYTSLRGNALAFPTSSQPYLAIDLQYIDRRGVSLFDFTGTGKTSGDDAQAANYEIDVNGLNLGGIGDNTPLRVIGFSHAFADAPADFDAVSVTDLSELPAGMAISWSGGSANPFSASSNDMATLDLTGAGRFHHFSQAGIRLDMNAMGSAPTLVAAPLGVGVFVIASGEKREVYLTFNGWLDAVQARLDGGELLKGILAVGKLDNMTAELTVRAAKAVFPAS